MILSDSFPYSFAISHIQSVHRPLQCPLCFCLTALFSTITFLSLFHSYSSFCYCFHWHRIKNNSKYTPEHTTASPVPPLSPYKHAHRGGKKEKFPLKTTIGVSVTSNRNRTKNLPFCTTNTTWPLAKTQEVVSMAHINETTLQNPTQHKILKVHYNTHLSGIEWTHVRRKEYLSLNMHMAWWRTEFQNSIQKKLPVTEAWDNCLDWGSCVR